MGDKGTIVECKDCGGINPHVNRRCYFCCSDNVIRREPKWGRQTMANCFICGKREDTAFERESIMKKVGKKRYACQKCRAAIKNILKEE